MMHAPDVLPHGSLALGRPDLVRAGDRIVCLRFETMKVLSALAAVESLLEDGVVAPGDTLVDSSSGIYAHALALACHRHGLHCHVVGSTTVDGALRAQLFHLGATVEQMPSSSSLRHDQHRRVARVRELLAEDPRRHWMRQYHDVVHQRGYRDVARWVHEALGDAPLTLVGGVGTGASTAGLLNGLREDGHPDVRASAVQPFGSVTFGAEAVDDPDIIIAGIGSSIPFANVHHRLYDSVHWLSFETARAATIGLLREHALFAGLSSGAAWLVGRHERERDPGRTVLFTAPDTGHRYVDAVFATDESPDLGSLAPRDVADRDELSLPWCRLAWDGRPAPDPARPAHLDTSPATIRRPHGPYGPHGPHGSHGPARRRTPRRPRVHP